MTDSSIEQVVEDMSDSVLTGTQYSKDDIDTIIEDYYSNDLPYAMRDYITAKLYPITSEHIYSYWEIMELNTEDLHYFANILHLPLDNHTKRSIYDILAYNGLVQDEQVPKTTLTTLRRRYVQPKWINNVVLDPERLHGVVFCHGRLHEQLAPQYLAAADWVYVTMDSSSQPDLAADITAPGVIDILGRGSYHYVLTVHCPLGGYRRSEFYENPLIASAYELLVPGGYFILDLGLVYLSTTVYNNLVRGHPELEEYLQSLIPDMQPRSNMSILYAQNVPIVVEEYEKQLNHIMNRYGFSSYYTEGDSISFIK